MQTINFYIERIIAIALLLLSMISCSKEESSINNLNETIYIRHENADMPAHIHGNGSEKVFLIILHGGPGANGLAYRVNSIRKEIEENNAVVYFDQRGSGVSQGNYCEDDISIDLMVDDVLALAKVIRSKYGKDSKLFLMGHSWGGTLGTAVLLKNQSEFSGWIDVDGAHNHKGLYDEYKRILQITADEQISLGNSIEFWEDMLDDVKAVGSDWSIENHLRLNSLAITAEGTLQDDQIFYESEFDRGDNVQRPNGLQMNWNMGLIGHILDYKNDLNQISYTNRLSEITIPSLVLWGKYDLSVPLIFAHEAHDSLGSNDKEIFIFEKSGHSPFLTEPDLFGDELIEFINTYK